MFGGRTVVSRRTRDEAEKPFWISFADLMTSLMVLFLVVMSVAVVKITDRLTASERAEAQQKADITKLMQKLQKAAADVPGVKVDASKYVIDFGDRAQFAFASSSLTPPQESVLRAFVPRVLSIANDSLGRRVLKRVIVEGFTDTTGTYLSNLGLSLKRSQRVLCSFFKPPLVGESPLTPEQLEQIRALFLVGGYSSNLAKASDVESRRVELRIEFLATGELRDTVPPVRSRSFGSCSLD